jgi:ferredoxin-NADP reductase
MTVTTSHEVTVDLEVVEVCSVSEGVRSIRLATTDGSDLPPWTPGAHVDLHLGEGLVRQYSLCGSLQDPATWRVAVLLELAGRGGSRWLHHELAVGDKVTVVGPRNHFELAPSEEYLFIAGGIGITPILPMLETVEASGAPWRLLYGGRRRESMAFLDELARFGDRVTIAPRDEVGDLDLGAAIAQGGPGVSVYCCGPAPLLAAVEQACAHLPAGRLHVERFAAKEIAVDPAGDRPFEVALERSGLTVAVGADESIVDALDRAGVQVETSCREGICGSCETRVLAGSPIHRDSILSEEEQESGDVMMLCVGRASTPQLVLDL